MRTAEEIAAGIAGGDRLALTRLISWAENGDPRYPAALNAIYPRIGKARRIGITGPPGAGKSTLTGALIEALRMREETVGILAIDPSSPFSGGALLGDRIRMEERTADPGVYIRSMASRDSHGGLARAAVDACDVMDAFGFSTVLMETVGVGQSEYDVIAAADTVVVVLCPGAGDGIQAMKAGILEVADVLAVNKSDLEGADRLVMDLEEAVHMRDLRRGPGPDWDVPVVPCSAKTGAGMDALLEAVDGHGAALEAGDLEAFRRSKRAAQVRRVVRERLEEELWERRVPGDRVDSLLEKSVTPYDVAEELLGALLNPSESPTGRKPDGSNT